MHEVPYKVIVTNANGHTSQVVRLTHAPHIGDAIQLPPHGATVRVWRVLSADKDSVSGVILAEAQD